MSDDEKRDDERSSKLMKAGVAVGIGSAAIVAALLYASKVKKPKRGGVKPDHAGPDHGGPDRAGPENGGSD